MLACVLVGACGGPPSSGQLEEGRGRALASSSASGLLLGNSLTAAQATTGDDMPAVLKKLAAARGRTLNVSKSIDLGMTLLQSWSSGLPQLGIASRGRMRPCAAGRSRSRS